MRTKLLALLLISSFLAGSFPALAEEDAPVQESAPIEQVHESVSLPGEPGTEILAEVTLPETDSESREETPGSSQEEAPDSLTNEIVGESIPALETTSPETVQAMEAAVLGEEPPAHFAIETAISLPNGCEVSDVNGITHLFPQATAIEYLAICALVEAKKNGAITSFTVTDHPTFGLSVASIDGVAPGATEYWALYLNDGYGSCGVECMEVAAGDELSFVLTNWMDESTSSELTIHIDSLDDAYNNVVVPSWCDVPGTTITYPKLGAPEYVAVCALVAAKAKGYIESFTITDHPTFGLSVASIDGVAPGATEYWALYLNDGYGSCGVECMEVAAGDELSFVLTNWMNESERARHELRVAGTEALSPKEDSSGGDGGGEGEPPAEDAFDIAAAYDFLDSLQQTDGSWESEIVTDWVALALGISGAPSGMKNSLVSYLKNEEPDFESVRDYMRHAMALMAVGLNPYTAGPSDYVTPIVDSFDGEQIDDPTLVNDDIFALIVLLNAGYDDEDGMIQGIVSFIVSEQRGNGSWEGSADLTAAGIQALDEVRSLAGVTNATSKAKEYLAGAQKADGGFGDPFATAWGLQAIEALGDSPDDWKNAAGKTPLTYLADSQEAGGGLKTTPNDAMTRAWATAYAIPAVKELTWSDILRDFNKPAGEEGGSGEKDGADETVTTTDPVATTTPVVMVDPPMLLDADEMPLTLMDGLPEEAAFMASVVAPFTPRAQTAPDSPAVRDAVGEAVAATEEAGTLVEEDTRDLTASVSDSGAWEWVKRFLASTWSFFAGLFS